MHGGFGVEVGAALGEGELKFGGAAFDFFIGGSCAVFGGVFAGIEVAQALQKALGKNEKTGLVHHITPKVSPRAAQVFVPGNKVRVRGHEDVWYVTGIDLVNNTVSIERFFGGTVCKSYVEPEILELVA